MNDNNDHLEQVRRFILKNGFQELIIISCDLKTGNAYITEGNHHLWVAHKEGIPSIYHALKFLTSCPQMVLINSSILIFFSLKTRETILPENSGLTVAKTGFN